VLKTFKLTTIFKRWSFHGTCTVHNAKDQESGISKAFMKSTGRKPIGRELKILLELQNAEYEKFKGQTDKSKGWLEAGEYKVAKGYDKNLVAANAVVASAILNSDASITKR